MLLVDLTQRLHSHASASVSTGLADVAHIIFTGMRAPPTTHSSISKSGRLWSRGHLCRATREGLTLERPQELNASAPSSRRQPSFRAPDRPHFSSAAGADVSRHNQALLRWLDELAVDLEFVEGQELEEELQRTVEVALKVQAQRGQQSTVHNERSNKKRRS
ncbi:hypothetical protein COCSUDRAFT_53826 [Coccomyxa subellipsoidea C-169]|uniref:Uncharacterized protein n=1 Tax=Coccomyxa subellipsoidea (strain C-169) TaxID=574566 RepID=I0YVQ4_COCSC|nr:hypothetical protein COCSUDRAFT_53826 [Coccomyxa subellipsoidea C-169]EIE22473.1 hypothetical protein COCSUDRAFT_53826 [Coccomyxa subellipsoidea C-169]|eukprot:XP_005647017.1 hypothetical protein COCSUDRAFT_53826 [Coccomyxa subellipsoidea C-169]